MSRLVMIINITKGARAYIFISKGKESLPYRSSPLIKNMAILIVSTNMAIYHSICLLIWTPSLIN